LPADRRPTFKAGFGDVRDSAGYSITTNAQRDGLTRLDENVRSSDGTLRSIKAVRFTRSGKRPATRTSAPTERYMKAREERLKALMGKMAMRSA